MKKEYVHPQYLPIDMTLEDILTTSTAVDKRDEDELPVVKFPRGIRYQNGTRAAGAGPSRK